MRVIVAILVATSGLVMVKSELDAVPFLPKCERNQQLHNLEKCVQRGIESMTPCLRRGYPSLDIPTFEPHYEVDNFRFTTMEHFTGNMWLFDIRIGGLTEYSISNVRITPNLSQIKFDANFPNINMRANYYIKGMILGMNVSTPLHRLDAELIRNAVTVTIDGSFRLINKDEKVKEYFVINNVQVNLSIGWNNFFFQGIDKNRDVSIEINEILKRNWYKLETGVLAQLKPAVTDLIRRITSGIFSIPMDELMLY